VGSRLREINDDSTVLLSFISRSRDPTKVDNPVKLKYRFSNKLPDYIISVNAALQGPLITSVVSEKA
jgi:hypothetical protein